MSKENPLVSQETPAAKKESFQKEILNIAKEHKTLIGISLATASTIAGAVVMFEYLRRKAQKDLQPELERIAATLQEDSGSIREKQGNSAICLVASYLARELEETEGGRKVLGLVKNFYQQISGVLGLPPVRSSEEEIISSEEEIISSACAIANIIEPEEKKEGD